VDKLDNEEDKKNYKNGTIHHDAPYQEGKHKKEMKKEI
jgi:hypothetical protein